MVLFISGSGLHVGDSLGGGTQDGFHDEVVAEPVHPGKDRQIGGLFVDTGQRIHLDKVRDVVVIHPYVNSPGIPALQHLPGIQCQCANFVADLFIWD